MTRCLDGNTIKQLTSGGNTLIVRKLYQNSRPMLVQAGLMINANALPTVSPPDALETQWVFKFLTQFLSPEQAAARWLLGCVAAADPGIKAYVRRPEVCAAVIHAVLDAYSPEPLVMPAQIVEQTTDLQEKHGVKWENRRVSYGDLVVTKNINDFVSNDTILEQMGDRLELREAQAALIALGACRKEVNGKKVNRGPCGKRGLFGVICKPRPPAPAPVECVDAGDGVASDQDSD